MNVFLGLQNMDQCFIAITANDNVEFNSFNNIIYNRR